MRHIAIILALFALPAIVKAQLPGLSIYYLGADVCGADANSQFFLMKTGAQAYNFNTAPPQIKSLCPAGYQSGIITAYQVNPTAITNLNAKTGGCTDRIFYDVMSNPGANVIPPNTKVLVFCSPNPDIAALPPAAFAALCGTSGFIPVAFGNHIQLSPFFHNSSFFPDSCGAYSLVEANFGGLGKQEIVYNPSSLAKQDGAYVAIEPGNVVRYGLAANCTVPGLSCPQQPIVQITGDMTICQGERTSITANAGQDYFYTWDNGTQGPSIEVGPEITSHYIVTAINKFQLECATAALAVVEVFTFPSDVIIDLPGNPYCLGDTVELKWKFERPVPNNYVAKWVPPRPGIVLYQDKIMGINEETEGTYKLVITFDNGCTLIRNQNVGYMRPVPVLICTNTPVCQFEDVLLEASAPGTLFSWSGPNNFTATGPVHVLDDPASGAYIVTVTDGDGCTSTGVAAIVVNDCIPGNTAIGDRIWKDLDRDGVQDPNEPGIANMKIFLAGDTDNDEVDDYLDSTLTNTVGRYYFHSYPAGRYYLYIRDAEGYFVTQLDMPLPPYHDDTKDNDFIAEGIISTILSYNLVPGQINMTIDAGLYCLFTEDSISISCNSPTTPTANNGSIQVDPSGGAAPYNYDWVDLPGTNNIKDRSNLDEGIYTVIITDNAGCTATASCDLVAPQSMTDHNNKAKKSKNNDAHRPTNTSDVQATDKLSVYPNPANTTFFVELPTKSPEYIIEVYDMLGRLVHTGKGSGTVEIEVKGWFSGIYTVKAMPLQLDGQSEVIWEKLEVVR